jgi:hypothetical protein
MGMEGGSGSSAHLHEVGEPLPRVGEHLGHVVDRLHQRDRIRRLRERDDGGGGEVRRRWWWWWQWWQWWWRCQWEQRQPVTCAAFGVYFGGV